jgi:hypothetical protein
MNEDSLMELERQLIHGDRGIIRYEIVTDGPYYECNENESEINES